MLRALNEEFLQDSYTQRERIHQDLTPVSMRIFSRLFRRSSLVIFDAKKIGAEDV